MFSSETAVVGLSYGAPVKRVGFRGRLFLILLAFALVPSILISLAWTSLGSYVLPSVSATAAWDSVTATGERAIGAARSTPLKPPQQQLLDAHEANLREAQRKSHQAAFVFNELA